MAEAGKADSATNDIDREKYKELELVAYGCNKRVSGEFSEFLDKEGIQSFTFYEFFCAKPISRQQFTDRSVENVSLLCPFVKRYTTGSPLLPTKAELSSKKKISIDAKIRNKETLCEFYEPFVITAGPQDDTWLIVSEWAAGNLFPFAEEKLILSKSISDFKNYLEKADVRSQEEMKKEFAIVDMPWFYYLDKKRGRKATFIYWPIASDKTFYGELLLILAGEEIDKDIATKGIKDKTQKQNRKMEITEKRKKILRKLKDLADKEYLPLSILFENYWQEKRLEAGNYKKEDNPFHELSDSDSKLEKTFYRKWGWREDYSSERLKSSLIMTKYIVASPGMISKVTDAITLDPSVSGTEIPCVLVIGGPGTGKEKMAKLISGYSQYFHKTDIYTINLASLQPKQIVGPVISGFSSDSISIKGLLQQIIIEKSKDDPVAIIFDELNSLDIDSQGILLRLIENRELETIGTIGRLLNKDKKILIIGLMNEDPEKLVRLGKFRHDLFYRMKRSGIIYLPELAKRAEDLPFLFYKFLQEELWSKTNEVNIDLIIMYESFEVLMDGSIRWAGNIRQLQAVAKTAAKILLAENLTELPIIVNEFVIRNALAEHKLIGFG